MAINTFSTLKSAVGDWLDRTDIDNAIDNMISLMESRLYRSLRVRDMESALSVTISSGVATLPTDFLALKYAYIDGSPAKPMMVQSADWVLRNHPLRSSTAKPTFVAVDAGTLIFGPFPDSDYTVKGTYYAKPAALSATNESNFLVTDWPDLALYGTLVHSAMFLGQDSRLTVWEAAYQEIFDSVMSAEKAERFPPTVALAVSAQ